MLIAEVDSIIKELFKDSLISSIKSVYELSDDGKFYKLILSFHLLKYNDTTVLHTKLLFKVDMNKTELISDSFGYLYDINCVYKYRTFKDTDDLKTKLDAVFGGFDFGKDLKALSEFISQAATSINFQLNKMEIENVSVFEVKYNPKFKITACELTEFNFDINVSNNYKVDLNLSKTKNNKYLYKFTLADKTKELEANSLSDIPVIIANGISDLMGNITESKQLDF